MLPLLTVLFLVSYGLMAMLVVEQGHTIDSQRNLIRQLFSDSTELNSMKGKAVQKQRTAGQGQAQSQAAAPPAAPKGSGETAASNNSKSAHNATRRPVMPKPPRDASEMADERRSLMSI